MGKNAYRHSNVKGSVLIEFLIALPILLLLFGVTRVFVSVYKEKAVLREAARLGVAATQYVADVDSPDNPIQGDLAYLNELGNLAVLVAYNNVLAQGLNANDYNYQVNYIWDNGGNENDFHWTFNGYNTKNQGRLYISLAITTNRITFRGILSYVGIANARASTESAILPLQNSIAGDSTRLAALPLGLLGAQLL